ESIGHAAHIKDSQQEENYGANDNALDRRSPTRLFNHPANRKHNGCSDDKHEHRKDEIVEMETGPFTMLHLRRQTFRQGRLVDFGQRANDEIAADDPEHVETAEGIERYK